jgi:hypothetical protein
MASDLVFLITGQDLNLRPSGFEGGGHRPHRRLLTAYVLFMR